MYWLFVLGALILITIGLYIADYECYGDFEIGKMLATGFTFIAALFIVVGLISTNIDTRAEIASFEQQKIYCETHIPKNDIEDAALTTEKMELNGWLASMQEKREMLGNWSFVPEEILDVEPIE